MKNEIKRGLILLSLILTILAFDFSLYESKENTSFASVKSDASSVYVADVEYSDTYEDDETEQRDKIWNFIGIGSTAITIILLLYAVSQKKKKDNIKNDDVENSEINEEDKSKENDLKNDNVENHELNEDSNIKENDSNNESENKSKKNNYVLMYVAIGFMVAGFFIKFFSS